MGRHLTTEARTQLVAEANAGYDYGSLAARYGLSSRHSVKVIVCVERKRIGCTTLSPRCGRPSSKGGRPPIERPGITLAGGYVFRAGEAVREARP